MKPAIFILFFFTASAVAQERFGKIELTQDKDQKQWSSAQVFSTKDSARLAVYQLKVMPLAVKQAGGTTQIMDVLTFEDGNPYSGSVAIVVSGATAQSIDFLTSVRDVMAQSGRDNIAFTQDELVNILLTMQKWLSDKKLKR